MCGIVGVAFAERTRIADSLILEKMASQVQHRGPNDYGFEVFDGCGLAMRRLSVIDIEGGGQPIFNEDRTVAVVLNGEIYNFRELRTDLQSKGHSFSSHSDTEVLVHLYEEYGEAFAKHLNGMFAVAIWDLSAKKLILVRDRLGVKPLYYFSTLAEKVDLLFASEIKSLLVHHDVPRTADVSAIDGLFRFGHINAPHTCFKDISELPPGHMLVFCGGEINIRKFWDLSFPEPSSKLNLNLDDATQVFHSLLSGAVRKRLFSDVSVGAFLSGGIDSSIIVALMSKIAGGQIKTFSIGFENEKYSELRYARQVADLYSTDHTEFVVSPEVESLIPELVRCHDSPFYDTSAIPTYYLCKMASKEVTVALSGDGGDEMFAGYQIYQANIAADLYSRLPSWFRKYGCSPLIELIPERVGGYRGLKRVAKEFNFAADSSPLERYSRWASKIKSETRQQLYQSAELCEALKVSDREMLENYFNTPKYGNELDRLLYIGLKTELASDMLVKVDRMSMANSIEVRSPMLDFELFEFAARLGDHHKVSLRQTKILLRNLAMKLLPKNIVNRPKRGFSIPLDDWMRNDLNVYAKDTLLGETSQSRGLINTKVMERLIREHERGDSNWGREIWTSLSTEIWHQMYIDGENWGPQ